MSVYDDPDCNGECCSGQTSARFQPHIDYSTVKKTQGKQSRVFQKIWFADYKWLSFCTTCNVVFCYYCRTMTSQGKLTLSKKCDEAFSSRGYDNWKKAIEKFKEHEKSQGHREACMKYRSQKGPSVISLMNARAREEQKRQMHAFKAAVLSQISHATRISCSWAY